MAKKQPTEVIQLRRRRIPVWRMSYRFLTGLHLDGKQRRNYRTGHVMPQYRDYFWNRYSRPQRALWRIVILWAVIMIAYGLKTNYPVTLYWLAASLPFAIACVVYKMIDRLTTRVNFRTGEGVSESYRTLRPKYYRRLQRIRTWRFKLRPPVDTAMPPDWERPILAELAEDGVAPVQSLRRPLEELIAEHGPASGRNRTHRRNANRRLPK